MTTTYFPISYTVPQYMDQNGDPYSGAVLKAYRAGTSTPISMATDFSGGTLVSTITLNAAGYPAVSGNVVIPHVAENIKLMLYPDSAAAAANTGEIWEVDDIQLTAGTSNDGPMTDIASAATISLNSTTTNYFNITGTTAISTITLAEGVEVTVVFAGAARIINSSNLISLTGADIIPVVGAVAKFRGEASGVVRMLTYQAPSNPVLLGMKDTKLNPNTLILSNNTTDASNDIDISAGTAISDDGTMILAYAGGTIQSDVVFDDTGNKGLDTGTVGNNWYHVWLVGNPTTGTTKAICSLSATAPTLFTGYTKKKCIGSFKRVAGVILPFTQRGNTFKLTTPVLDVTVAGTGTAANTATLASVPSGVVVEALINTIVAGNTLVYISDLTSADIAPSTSAAPIGQFGSGAANTAGNTRVFTNASQQIRFRTLSNDTINIATLGWVDPRI